MIANELRRLAEGHRDDDGLSLARRMSLGLLDMTRRSVSFGERSPGSRPEVVLVAHVGLDGDIAQPAYEDGLPVSRRVFENLSCDATVRTLIVNGRSEPLDLGRSQRLTTAGQRRAAAVRDGGCVVPGCDQPPEHCDLHHIRHWLHGGATDLANLCLLCGRGHGEMVVPEFQPLGLGVGDPGAVTVPDDIYTHGHHESVPGPPVAKR